jgi:hypothetical protein
MYIAIDPNTSAPEARGQKHYRGYKHVAPLERRQLPAEDRR